MSAPLLNYIVYIAPDPLQASPQTGDPSFATLTIVVSNLKGHTVNCQSIEFAFVEGTNPRDFFADSTGISATANSGWSLTQSGSVFTAKPTTPEGGEIGPQGLVFILSDIKVNEQPGTTEMTVVEESSSGIGTLSLPLGKFPPQFTVGDLLATPDTVPQGGSTLLTWSGSSGATYELHYTNEQGELVRITHPAGDPNDPLPSTGSYQIDNLQANTTFYLSATVSIPGEDGPLKVERPFPVTVQIPPVQIVSFTVGTEYVCSTSSPSSTYALLSWDVANANQILLNGNVVDGNSATVPISVDTQFTLGATGSPETIYKTIQVSVTEVTAQISVTSGNSVEVIINAPAGTYTVDWSVDWETGETAGTSTNSMTVTSDGSPQTVVWNNVPMDMPPPYAGITTARCTITTSNDASAAPGIASLRSLDMMSVEEVEELVAGATLLTYAIQTTPDPLQASPQTGTPSLATLTIVVSNSTRQYINCQRIIFSFLQGTNARDFFSDSTGISTVAPAGWSISQQGSSFTATPKTPQDGQIGPGSLVFMLFNIKVNQQPGTTPMTITEVTAGSAGGSTNTGTQTVTLAKFPAQFFVAPLQANPVNVALGDSTTLTWNGTSGATYVIQYQDADGNLVSITHPKGEPDKPLPSTGSYTVSNLQVNPTVFTLIVTMQVPGSDTPLQVQRQAVVAVSQLTVNFEARPTTVPANGVTKLSWRTTQATSCILDPGDLKVPTNGLQYVLVTTGSDTQTFTLTVYGNAGLSKQAQIIVSVDRTIQPTNTISSAGQPGQPGVNQGVSYEPITGGNGGQGLPGGSLILNCTLDPSSKPSTVFLVDASGGTGGPGGKGSDSTIGEEWGTGGNGGTGGQGGDGGTVTLIFDPSSGAPAGYIVVSRAGKGGGGGAGGQGAPPGSNGQGGPDGKPGQIFLKANPHVLLSQPSGTSIEVSFDAPAGTYKVNWSVFWQTGETSGTATNSMTLISDGGPQTVAWDNVPMDQPPPYGQIISATCTIEGFEEGPMVVQWPQS